MEKTHTIKLHLWKVYLGIDQQKSEKKFKNDTAKLQKKSSEKGKTTRF